MKGERSKKYVKKDPISHILLRPDMYVGSTEPQTFQEYIVEALPEYRIYKKEITFPPAILRIFIEALSNAIDNVERSKDTSTPCTKIKITLDQETGETSVWNDGEVIPIELNPMENCYNHSLIFGELLTGSNYDDTTERTTSGRNGVGIKVCNVFSQFFSVEGLDPFNHKTFHQTWTGNMRSTTLPVIKSTKNVKGYTKVTWIPDFTQFKIPGYTSDIISLYLKYMMDTAMLTQVKVYYNDQLLPVSNLASYAKLYHNATSDMLSLSNRSCQVVLTPSIGTFQAISFVNGIHTKLGGQHVDAWTEAIFRPLLAKINKKGRPNLNISDIKQFFNLFVVCRVPNPKFEGQNKQRLEFPSIQYCNLKASQLKTILKWRYLMDHLEDMMNMKEMMVMKKSQRKKKGFIKIEGLDSANNAGTQYSKDCTLILCEGLSAKTYAVAGIKKGVYGKSGRDWWGIYPLRGKLLNVRNANPSAIAKNREITDIIQAVGLQYDTDYTQDENFKQLRYGKIMIITDADTDGIHIEGLILNLFHALFPTLLQRKNAFVVSMKTPIVRIFQRGGDRLFYDERNFRNYVATQKGSFKKKYYKGLGSTKAEDVKDTFGLKLIEFATDDTTLGNMNKVFHKKYAHERKEWLEQYQPHTSYSLDHVGSTYELQISKFINEEMIKFSMDDCKRNLPNCMDGFKESQRKVLYAIKKRKLCFGGNSLKVAQLGGYVAEHTNYHHGEHNLFDTITKMANEYPGSNNIPLLYRDGMFGTRSFNGKDAASARYINTKMDRLTSFIFRDEDEPLLDSVVEDGDKVEPKFYLPIIPMILVNGCTGIGTGWSCTIPSYNPLDLIDAIQKWLDDQPFPELMPWYRGFKGTIKKIDTNRYLSEGVVTEKGKGKVLVTEIPIGMSIDKFKSYCDELEASKQIKTSKNYSTPNEPHFLITESKNSFKCTVKNLKLQSSIHTSNMVLFDRNGTLHKFSTVEDILTTFCQLRLEYYAKRKQYLLREHETAIRTLHNKQRFLKEVRGGIIKVMNVPESQVILNLEKTQYDKEDGTYEYLLRLQIRTFTKERIQQLEHSIMELKKKIIKLKTSSPKQLWKEDLLSFQKAYLKL